jgi:hypothetical protein
MWRRFNWKSRKRKPGIRSFKPKNGVCPLNSVLYGLLSSVFCPDRFV